MLNYIKSICYMFGSLFGFSRPAFYGGLVLLGLGLIVLAVAIILIVKMAKRRKAKKEKVGKIEEHKQDKQVDDAIEMQAQPVVEPAKEQQVVAETKEPAKEEPSQAVEEEKQEAISQEAPAVEEKKTSKKTTKKLNGKWIVEKESENEFVSKLLASNGEVMLTSEIYTTEEGARNGIETIIRSIEADNFSIYQDKNNNYYYKIKSANKRLLCVGEIYKSKDGCLKAVDSVKRIAKDSMIVEGVKEGQGYAEYTPATLDLADVKKGTSGKWRIVKLENGCYSARLFASNGQLMLATEQVTLEKSAKNAIESVKKNAEQGNFIIDRDKFGRFYYKLRNAQKSVICIGEAYVSLDSCVSAIESVRRFSLTAVLSND